MRDIKVYSRSQFKTLCVYARNVGHYSVRAMQDILDKEYGNALSVRHYDKKVSY